MLILILHHILCWVLGPQGRTEKLSCPLGAQSLMWNLTSHSSGNKNSDESILRTYCALVTLVHHLSFSSFTHLNLSTAIIHIYR